MGEDRVQRRLAAIVATDIVAYSRLMETDEEGTLAAVKALRAELFDPKIAEHNGRIVKTTGDGTLIEFPSVVDAVRSAVAIQRGMADRNAGISEDRRIVLRIGINLGDVIAEGDDIYGDGVNVAARLEEKCDPGEVMISGTAYDQLKAKVDVGYESLGEQRVKNIAEPVRVYRVLMAPERAGELLESSTKATGQRRSLAVAAALLIAIAGGGAWWWQSQPDFEPADPKKMAYSLPEKPSIAVLPFDNMSGDPEQDYLGDGLTENIIAVLSTSPDLFVIARNSSFTYKGKPVEVQEVAERFGVRYVLEGSVQRQGERLRVTAQLVDAIDGRHLWAERYDRELKDMKDLFPLQDDITQKILVAMNVELLTGDSARRIWEHVGDLETYRLFKQANTVFQTTSPEGNREAERLIREALKRQPENGMVNSFLGYVHWQKIALGISKDPKKDMDVAREFAEKSLSFFEENYDAYTLLATLDMYAANHESAIAHADRAIELAPTSGHNIAIAGWIKSFSGQPQEALALLKRAMRLEPYHWEWVPGQVAFAHLQLGQYDQAIPIYEGSLASSADNPFTHTEALYALAAIAVFKGDMSSARQYIEKLLAIQSNANVSSASLWVSVMKDRAFLERYLDALREAGLPE